MYIYTWNNLQKNATCTFGMKFYKEFEFFSTETIRRMNN